MHSYKIYCYLVFAVFLTFSLCTLSGCSWICQFCGSKGELPPKKQENEITARCGELSHVLTKNALLLSKTDGFLKDQETKEVINYAELTNSMRLSAIRAHHFCVGLQTGLLSGEQYDHLMTADLTLTGLAELGLTTEQLSEAVKNGYKPLREVLQMAGVKKKETDRFLTNLSKISISESMRVNKTIAMLQVSLNEPHYSYNNYSQFLDFNIFVGLQQLNKRLDDMQNKLNSITPSIPPKSKEWEEAAIDDLATRIAPMFDPIILQIGGLIPPIDAQLQGTSSSIKEIDKRLSDLSKQLSTSNDKIEAVDRKIDFVSASVGGIPGQLNPSGHLIATVPFDTGSSELNSEANSVLESLRKNVNLASRLSILGSADRTGSKAKSLQLSRERAECIARWVMNEYGVLPKNISIGWTGASTKKRTNEQNRVVEVYLY